MTTSSYPVTTETLIPLVERTLSCGLVPMIHGDAGVGKSSIARSLAKKHNLLLIDIRLPNHDPVDLNGMLTRNNDRATYLPVDLFPLDTDSIPEGYDGWLILLDELPAASPMLQVAAYRLLLDKQIGNRNLHSNAYMIAAGNLVTSGAISNRMGTAMQSRMVHYLLQQDVECFINYAIENDFDSRVIAYVKYKRGIFDYKKDHGDFTFTCSRTLELLSEQIKDIKGSLKPYMPLIVGTIGHQNGIDFVALSEITLPNYEEIVANPETVEIPTQIGHLYIMMGHLVQSLEENDLDKVYIFVERLSLEYQTVFNKWLHSKHPHLYSHPLVDKWVTNNLLKLKG